MASNEFSLRQIFTQSAIYWVGIILSKIIGFAMIPFYSHFLSPDEYGVLELVSLTVDIASLIVGLQLVSAVAKFYDEKQSEQEKKGVVSTALIISIIMASAIMGGMATQGNSVSWIVFKDDAYAGLFQYMFLAAMFSIINEIGLVYLRIKDKSLRYVSITLTQLIIQISLTIYFVAFAEMSVLGVILAGTLASGGVFIYVTVSTLTATGLRFHKDIAKDMFRYSLPLVPALLGMFIMHNADRYILKETTSVADVGIYSLAYKFGILLNTLMVYPFNLVWGAKMFAAYRQENRNEILNNTLRWFSFFVATMAMFIGVFIYEVISILTPPAYHLAADIVPIILLAYVFNGASRVLYTPLYAEKRTRFVGVAVMISGIVSVIVTIPLSIVIGIYGAAIGTVIAFATLAFLGGYGSHKLTGTSWDTLPLAKLLLVLLVVLVIGHHVDTSNVVADLLLKAMLVALYFFTIFRMQFFNSDEILRWRAMSFAGLTVLRSRLQKD